MSTPADTTTAFAVATADFNPINGRQEDNNTHCPRQQATNPLQGVPFGGKSDRLSRLIEDRTDFAAQYGQNFGRLEADLPDYDPDIDNNAKNVVQVWTEWAWTNKLVNQALIEAAHSGLKNFFLAVVKKTCTKKMEDRNLFFGNVSSLKILEHLRSKCVDLEPADAINIRLAMMLWWEEYRVVPTYNFRMEDIQKKAD